jgi:ribose transport system substrate-binding protein
MRFSSRAVVSAGFVALAATLGWIGAGCTNPAATNTDASASPAASGAASPGASPAASPAAAALKLTEPAIPADAIPTGKAKKKYKIGVSLYTRDDEFYKALEKGLKDEAEKEGVEVDILSADKDLSKQVDQVQNFVAQKDDAIIFCPVDSKGVLSAVAAANAAGIPVFTADIAAIGAKVVSHVASDNVQGGKLVGEYAGKLLNGKGNVAIMDQSVVTSVQDRVKGFKEALKAFPGIKIVADEDVEGGKRENALPKATNVLTAHPDVNLIFGINDTVALGTLAALKQANKPDIDVVGFDAVPEAQTQIASGGQLKGDAIQYPHLIGAATIDTVVKSLNGEKVPPIVAIPTGLVNKDSFAK